MWEGQALGLRRGAARKYFLLGCVGLLLCALAGIWAGANGITLWKQSPRHLLVPGKLDFRRVSPSRHLKMIEISNPTGRPITIRRVVSSCGCAVPDLQTPRVVQPGETLKVQVRFDATGFTGPVKKRIVFYTDDVLPTEKGPKTVALVTHVVAFVERARGPSVVPAVLDFGRIGTWQRPSATVEVVNRGTVGLRIEQMKPAARFVSLEVEGDRRASLTIRVSLGPGAPAGPFALKQPLRTSQGEVAFEIRGEVYASPYLENEVLVFRGDRGANPLRKGVIVHHPPDCDPGDVEVTAEGWTVRVLSTERLSEGTARVAFALAPREGLRGKARGRIQVVFPGAKAAEGEFVLLGTNPGGESQSDGAAP